MGAKGAYNNNNNNNNPARPRGGGSTVRKVSVGLLVGASLWVLYLVSTDKGRMGPKLAAVEQHEAAVALASARGAAALRGGPPAGAAAAAAATSAATTATTTQNRVHVVFSTDCSAYQDWQSEVLFHSAMVVGHEGPVTRIASGCDEGQQRLLEERYARLYDDDDGQGGQKRRWGPFLVHHTPKFSADAKTGADYKFYNKPYGIEHLLDTSADLAHPIIALVDPDFVFTHPLSDVVRREEALPPLLRPWTRDALDEFFGSDVVWRVDRGKPVAQQYGLGAKWTTDFDRAKICTEPTSPCRTTTVAEAHKYFPVGPPYILHIDDWRRLAPTWREFAPRVYEQYPDLLAEMYAYCMAAAHVGLKHARVNHMMVSNVDAADEGWTFIDAMDLGETCGVETPRIVEDQRRANGLPLLPSFVHFCQNYRLGEWIFAKRRVPWALFGTCDHPLLEAPPLAAHAIDYELIPPGNPCRETPKRSPIKRHTPHATQRALNRTAWVLCFATYHVNAAAAYARDRLCDSSSSQPPAREKTPAVKLFDLATTCNQK